MRSHVAALRRLLTLLNYPISLSHELRRGWAEIQLALRSVHHYFKTQLPLHLSHERDLLFPALRPMLGPGDRALLEEIEIEYPGLENLARMMADIGQGWITSQRTPNRSEITHFTGLALELIHHLEQHIGAVESRLFPLIDQQLSPSEREDLENKVQAIDSLEPPRKTG